MKSSLAALPLLVSLIHAIWAFGAQAQSGVTETHTLESGKTIEREITAGGSHTYQIALEAGQFLRAVVNQRGIDVVVLVTRPDGQKISEVDSPNGTNGPEPISLSAEASGIYRLEIRPLDKDAKPGRYDVKIEEVLTAAEYGARLAEEKAMADATKTWLGTNAIRLTRLKQGVALLTCSL